LAYYLDYFLPLLAPQFKALKLGGYLQFSVIIEVPEK